MGEKKREVINKMAKDRLRRARSLKEEIVSLHRDLQGLREDLDAVKHESARRMIKRAFDAKKEKYERLKSRFYELGEEVINDIEALFGEGIEVKIRTNPKKKKEVRRDDR